MKKILVPTDFSSTAMKAAVYAAEISKRNKAAVYLLHVIEPITDNIRQPYPLHERLQEEILNNRMKELEKTQQAITRTYPGISIKIEVVKGLVINSILGFTEKQQIDLIVMGTKGATGIKEIFMGSVTAGIIRKAGIPVLSIPEEYQMEEPDGILFATDHFEENKAFLDKIVELAKLFSASIHIAVFEDTDTAEVADYIKHGRQLAHYMNYLKENYPGIDLKGELLEGKEFEETVEKYNLKHKVDIISMITYPKGFWERFLKKSATKKMAFHSQIPVLAIPAI